jgi:5-methylcytosine-specific restriction endonuclease McrA
VDGNFSDEQFKLLVFEHVDKGRRKFERLKRKLDSTNQKKTSSRPRIPENVRIEVWRRDGGKCVKCGSRENLEYDHIVPVSKGGSNSARNIELLCESCNRAKGAKIGG